ncbi:MAG TPA: LysR family transcriptional regulator [Baekduia sp.]|uniref:LysR family transcriptional regulator n=1 Tax=Baekduia sp. TaxID=2600305 RepID=UPI002D771AC4|nr:LysR family transcriptional regulator [Baekduia sp.]HET6509862.1 LysR family transcriptional regulator [Baekduia sp.]
MATALDLDHLRTLVAISECGGFSKAASALHMSQPALSQHVRLLERRLKRKLFEKDGRGMKLTPDGERVLAEARQILAVHDQALDRLDVRSEQVVVVGSTEHAAEQVLPEMIRALSEAFPDMTTRFEIARSTQLIESVGKGAVDFVFILASRGDEGGREIGQLPLKWYSAPGWEPPADGEALSLVAFEEPCALRDRALAALAADGHRVGVTGQSTTLEGVLAGVRAGLGVALLPSVGGDPAGLVTRDDLPNVGWAGLNLLARRGLDPNVELTAIAAAEAFFERHSRLLDVR